MKEILDKEWNGLSFNVMKHPVTTDIFHVWPKLESVPQYRDLLVDGISRNLVLRYIFIFYDMKSPIQDIDSLVSRKITAAKYAGFDVDADGKLFPSVNKEVLLCGSPSIRRAILTFCQQQKSFFWETYCAIQDIHYRNLELSRSSDSKVTTTSLIKEAEELTELRSKILSNDTNEKLEVEFHDYMMVDLNITPEDISDIINSGKKLDKN